MGAETFHGDPRSELRPSKIGQARATTIELMCAQVFPGMDEMGDPGRRVPFSEYSRIISTVLDQLGRKDVFLSTDQEIINGLTEKIEDLLAPGIFGAMAEDKDKRFGLEAEISTSDITSVVDAALLLSHAQGLLKTQE